MEASLEMIRQALLHLEVHPGSAFDGRTLAELSLRRRTGVSVVAVMRDGALETNPGPDDRLRGGDLLAIVGRPEQRRVVQAMGVA